MNHPITVGVDGSPESLAAADWAAREAVLRGLRLRLVNGWGLASPLEPLAAGAEAEQRRAEQLLRDTQQRVLSRNPELDVGMEAMADGPVAALLDASQDSVALVMGSRGLGAMAGFLLGSVSLQTVAHTSCPAVMVRTGNARGSGAPRGEEVLLGLKEPDEPDEEVLEFAFGAAASRGLPLRAVHAWKPPVPPSAFEPATASVAPGMDAAVAGTMAEALLPWRAKYERLEVSETAAGGNPSRVLVQEAGRAALVVVGRGGRRAGIGSRVGPVVHALLHHAGCPVAVVPHP